jgi:hypothetical protein
MATLKLPVEREDGGVPMPLILVGGVGLLAVVLLLRGSGSGGSAGTAAPGSNIAAALGSLESQLQNQTGAITGQLAANETGLQNALAGNTDYLNQQIAGTSVTLGQALTQIINNQAYLASVLGQGFLTAGGGPGAGLTSVGTVGYHAFDAGNGEHGLPRWLPPAGL